HWAALFWLAHCRLTMLSRLQTSCWLFFFTARRQTMGQALEEAHRSAFFLNRLLRRCTTCIDFCLSDWGKVGHRRHARSRTWLWSRFCMHLLWLLVCLRLHCMSRRLIVDHLRLWGCRAGNRCTFKALSSRSLENAALRTEIRSSRSCRRGGRSWHFAFDRLSDRSSWLSLTWLFSNRKTQSAMRSHWLCLLSGWLYWLAKFQRRRGRISDLLVDAGCNNGYTDDAFKAFVEGRAENDVGFRINFFAD